MGKLSSPVILLAVLGLASCAAVPQSAPSSASGGEASEQRTPPPALTSEPDVTVSSMWAFDVTDIDEIRKRADLIVSAEVTKIADRASFAVPGSGMPYTEVRLRVGDVLNGDSPGSEFTALYPGGTVTLRQVLNDSPRERAEKRRLTDLTADELDQRTESYAYDEQTDLLTGSTYVFALRQMEDGTYGVSPAGFAVFQVRGKTLVNDIAGATYSYAELRE